MKIVNLSLMANGKDIGLAKALKTKFDEYKEIQVNDRCFDRLANVDSCDLVFVQIQNDKIGKRNTLDLNAHLDRLRRKGAFVINWTGDIRSQTPSWMRSFNSDLTCFSNWRDVDFVKNRWGNPSDFLQIGIDSKVFERNHNLTIPYIPEIVFMGNHAGHFPLSKFRMYAVNALRKRYGHRFAVYGNGYPHNRGNLNAGTNNPNENQIREAYIYSQAKIGISISHFNAEGYFSDRLLRIAGSGCCVLSHAFPGHEELHNKGVIEKFTNIPDLLRVCDFLLDDDKHREEIRERGYKWAHENHTYDNMVEDILTLWKKWK